MTHTVSCTWLEEMAFETEVNGHRIVVDADGSVGGKDRGPRPKPLVLSALAGCTGMDVISILHKMKLVPSYFNVLVEGDLSEDHPKTYTNIRLVYEFKAADNLHRDKVQTAVELSQERYCGVSAMLKKGSALSYEIRYLE